MENYYNPKVKVKAEANFNKFVEKGGTLSLGQLKRLPT